MSFDKIILIGQDAFTSRIEQWASHVNNEVEYFSGKEKDANYIDLADAVVVFHENHNIAKEVEDLFSDFTNHNKTGHKIDINGTFAATKSNFVMWLERNKPKSLIIAGAEEIVKNERLDKFLNELIIA